MEILILTGMSGAGKSLAANYLEDMGFFCVDNLPPSLIPELIRTYQETYLAKNRDPKPAAQKGRPGPDQPLQAQSQKSSAGARPQLGPGHFP